MSGEFSLSTSRIRRARYSRVLSFVLLFLISYGSSTEIFHHHGLAAEKGSVSEKTNPSSANLFSDSEQKILHPRHSRSGIVSSVSSNADCRVPPSSHPFSSWRPLIFNQESPQIRSRTIHFQPPHLADARHHLPSNRT